MNIENIIGRATNDELKELVREGLQNLPDLDKIELLAEELTDDDLAELDARINDLPEIDDE